MPPNHHLFDTVATDLLGRKSLLGERRDQLERTKAKAGDASGTNAPVSVHLNFGEILHALQGRPCELPGPVQPAAIGTAANTSPTEPMLLSAAQQVNPGPRLSLSHFCNTYELSDELQTKLQANGFTTSHALRFVSLDDIKVIGLLRGELAQLRDAVSQWCGV